MFALFNTDFSHSVIWEKSYDVSTANESQEMNIANLYWHDGVITGMTFNPEGPSQILLNIELYSDPENAPDRDSIQIQCIDTKRFIATCDIFELNDNKGAGNILDGWVCDKVLRISLFGGYIEIVSTEYEVIKC